jgi:hypothetical protein
MGQHKAGRKCAEPQVHLPTPPPKKKKKNLVRWENHMDTGSVKFARAHVYALQKEVSVETGFHTAVDPPRTPLESAAVT